MNSQSSPMRYLITAAAIVVVIAGLREAQTLVVPFLLALFLAVALTPPLRWLESKRVPTPMAVLMVVVVVALLIGGVLSVAGRSVSDFTRQLPSYQRTMTAQFRDLESWIEKRLQDLRESFEEREDAKPRTEYDVREDAANSMLTVFEEPAVDVTPPPSSVPEPPERFQLVDPQWTVQVLRRLFGEIGALFSNATIILITVIFMLLEASRFPAKFHAAFGESSTSLKHLQVVVTNVRRYIAIKTLTSLLTGVAVTILTLALGIDFPVLLGLLAFLFNYVPNIGSIIAAIPAVVLALVDKNLGVAVGTAVGYVAINFFVSYAIEPRFMGRGLGLSTLVVFLSLVFWGWVLGPVGMLLSAPLTMVVKIVLEDFDDTRSLGLLMGSKAPQSE